VEVRLWWTYGEAEPEGLAGATVAVVDCLRATTTIAAALAAGAVAVVPMEEEEEARAEAARRGALLAGERHCLPPPGFDLGNSPRDFVPAAVGGREVVLWTTNGSRALAAAAKCGTEILAFALVNAAATADHIRRSGCRRLAVVCAGTVGRFALDDAFAAGALLARLGTESALEPDEPAAAALLLHRGGQSDPRAALEASRAAANLRRAGLGEDVAFAARPDALEVVAAWRDGALRRP
jgi:2-phosphosulfolactate phosphatase